MADPTSSNDSANKPVCFVIMPFGKKKDPSGGPDIDFDSIYEQAIRPGIEAAGMLAIRADEERTGGIIHKAMFERLLLCDFAVADITAHNANVYYELGVRHAVRPATTVVLFARPHQPLFDINYLRATPYDLAPGNRFGSDEAAALRTRLAEQLKALRAASHDGSLTDSPLFQMLTDYRPPDIARLKTDLFRDRMQYAAERKEQLADARARRDADGIARVEKELGNLDDVEAGVLVDLFLSYRALQQWDRMIALYDRMPGSLQRMVIVREQYGFALNRKGERQRALGVLEDIVSERGPSSETCGLIGRVYKDLWSTAVADGATAVADGYLNRAINAYVDGFEADWRDAYPGINAVTLLDVRGDQASKKRQQELLPVVRFAVVQRLRSSKPDYWDYATLLELAVLDDDEAAAPEALCNALTSVREAWEPKTTANNLNLIRTSRQKRGIHQPWLDSIIQELEARAAGGR
jgi:hypothetical protein